jgi:hypothetical protein
MADVQSRVTALEEGQGGNEDDIAAIQSALGELAQRVELIEQLPDIMRRLEQLEAELQ